MFFSFFSLEFKHCGTRTSVLGCPRVLYKRVIFFTETVTCVYQVMEMSVYYVTLQACSFLQCHHLQRMWHWLLAHLDCEWHGLLTQQMDWSRATPSMWPDWRGEIQWLPTHLQTLNYCSLTSPTLTHMSWWRLVFQPATVQERVPGV